MPYLANYYEQQISTASLEKSKFPDQVRFNNEKAVLRKLIVIQDEKTSLYGVDIINSNGTMNTVISPRYTQVEYMEGTEDFIVTTEDKKVGIIGSDGLTKVKPNYDKIEVIDKDIGLYLVTSNNKQGVINSNGKIIIHQDYDSIGLDVNSNANTDVNVTNKYLLLDNAIPVELNNKWGLIDKNGKTIVPVEYDGIGCTELPDTGNKNTNAVVVIPEMRGIVVEIDSKNESNGTVIRKYGIKSASGEMMIADVLDNVYSTTVADITTYYVTTQNQAIDIVNWWRIQQSEEANSGNNEENVYNGGDRGDVQDDGSGVQEPSDMEQDTQTAPDNYDDVPQPEEDEGAIDAGFGTDYQGEDDYDVPPDDYVDDYTDYEGGI